MNVQFLIPPVPLAVVAGVGLVIVVGAIVTARERWLAWLRRAGMLAMAVAMGVTPAVSVQTRTLTSNLAVLFVVDATGSMAAQDYGDGRRLDGVKADAAALLNALPEAHVGIVEYSSQATEQLPLTTDKQAARTWFDVYDREMTDFSAGSSINRPVEEVRAVLERMQGERYVPVIIVMTDGEATDAMTSRRDEAPDYSAWAPLVEGGFVLGYGTEAGAPMLRRDAAGETGELITAPTGEVAISKANPEALRTIAGQIGVPYVHRNGPGGIEELARELTANASLGEGVEENVYSPIIWPFAVVLALLGAWELFDLMPRVRAVATMSTRRATLDTGGGRR